ncbi:MAG TPA: nitroreductase family protein [Candidatus Dormibacteraeota bacterium]|jgi:nitroreductase
MRTNAGADSIAFLRGLRAVRQFRPEPVPEAAVEDILQVVRWSGSASNQQPWELVLVRDPETLRQLAEAEGFARHLAGAPLAVVLVMANRRPEQDTYDEGRLSERIMLAASAHGLGSSIGWFRGAGVDRARKLLGIPVDRLVRTAISIGYPTLEAAQRGRKRKPMASIVHVERYGAGSGS